MIKPLRVLMVEDSESDALLLIRELKKGGYEPEYECVETAETMRAALLEKSWDVILCDYKLPRFSGLQAVSLLGETGIDIPIIIVSGAIGEETAVEAMKTGADDYVMKGNLSRLVPAVEREIKDAVMRRERRQAEEALHESEEKYRSLASTADAMYLVDRECRYLFMNEMHLSRLGMSLDEIAGKPYADLHSEEDTRKFSENVERVVETGESFQSEHKSQRDGRCFLQTFSPVKDSKGSITAVTVTSKDITERKRAEEESKAHIRFLESLERIDQAIKQETEIEQMLGHIIKTVFSIFDCDRAWLLYPCDPDAPSFRVPVEITRPEYPGAKVLNIDVPMSPGEAQNMREALESDDPVTYTAGTERPIRTAKQFGVQSQMFIPVYPKLGKPWVFGMHQCSYPRIWTEEEQRLFKEIGRRISDGLSSVLFLRELQENEERFRATFEQAAVGIAHVAPDGRWMRVNRKLCDIVGYSREELLTKTFQDITHPDDLDADLEYVRKVLAGEIQTYSKEKRYIRKDGSIVWINLTVSTVHHASGRPGYFISVIEDTTERKRAEDALRNSEGRLHTLVQTIPDLIWLKDKDGVYLSCNTMFERFFGAREADIVGKTDYDFVDRELADFFREHDRKAMAAGKPTSNEEWITFADDGHRALLDTIKTPMYDAEGKLIGVLGVARDITERKRAEDMLRISEGRYRMVEAIGHVGNWEYNLQTTKFWGSDEAKRIYGFDPEALDFSTDEVENCIPERERVHQALVDLIEADKPYNLEFEIHPKNSLKPRIISSVAELKRDEHGNPLLVTGLIQDITERKRAEERYKNLAESSLAGVFIVQDGKFRFINTSAIAYAGYSAEELIGQHADTIVHPEDREMVKRKGLAMLLGKDTSPYEFRMVTKQGEIRWIMQIVSPIQYEGKQAILGNAIDITERKQSFERIRKSLGATVQAMAYAVETRDPYTAGHQRRVADLARAIATEMNLSSDQIDGIRTASVIHDIGKISVPAEILSKPTKLTDIEFSLIKTHSQSGYDILKDIEFPWPIARIVLEHHERMDGSGYPNGLTGENLLVESRILAVADVVEAIASHRPYRAGLGIDAALDEIAKNNGTLYDQEVVVACKKLFCEKGYIFNSLT